MGSGALTEVAGESDACVLNGDCATGMANDGPVAEGGSAVSPEGIASLGSGTDGARGIENVGDL